MKKCFLVVIVILCISGPAIGQTTEATSQTFNFYIKSRDKAPPVLFWLNPNSDVTLSKEQQFKLKVGIKCPSQVKNVIIKLNGEDLANSRGMGVVSGNTQSGEYDLFIDNDLRLIEGDNKVELTVINAFGNQAKEERIIRYMGGINNRTDRALLFATDHYDNWDNLSNPVNDARTIAKELQDTYGFEVELLEDNNIQDILIKLREYASKVYMEDDQLFIFFAGHGHYDQLLGDGYIVGHDSRSNDPANTSYLSYSVLGRALNNLPAKHVFLTMDVCFGGTFDAKLASADRGSVEVYAEVSRQEFATRRLKYKTRKFLTSGGKEYVPDGRPGMHSPFAKKFIEALRTNGGQDRILTLSEILNVVSTINPAPHFGDFGDNEAGSDFIFMVK